MIASYKELRWRDVQIPILTLIAAVAFIVVGVGGASAEPTLALEPIGTKTVGDIFEIAGQTTFPAGDNLFVTITQENRPASGVAGSTRVLRGGTKNRFSFTVDTSRFSPGRYTVTVDALSYELEESTSFDLVGPGGQAAATTEGIATAKTTTGRTGTTGTLGSVAHGTVVTATTEPGTTKTPGPGVALALEATAVALLARAGARRRTGARQTG